MMFIVGKLVYHRYMAEGLECYSWLNLVGDNISGLLVSVDLFEYFSFLLLK